MAQASPLHELKTLILSFHPLVVIETPEEERVVRLAAAAARGVGLSFYAWTLGDGLRIGEAGDGNPLEGTAQPLELLRTLRQLDRPGIFLLKDLAPHLADPAVIRALRDQCQRFAHSESTLILTGPSLELPAELATHAAYLRLALPDRNELRDAINALLESLEQRKAVELRLSREDVDRFLDALRGLTLNQARQAVAYAVIEDGVLAPDDLPRIFARKARILQDSGLLEYFPHEDNRFELGGFTALGAWLDRARHGFGPEAASLGLAPPKGILLTGVQGCGKSLAAKVVARRWRLPLVKLDAGRLFDAYVGQSEKNLRRALELAEFMAPVVLWIDEIEKAVSNARADMHDGGLARRMQGHLLTWLQERSAPVFCVATCNDVFALPPELIRKGRFDEIFFVDLPDPAERRAIFEIHLRQRRQDPTRLPLDDLVFASDGFSGAEIEQVVIAALYRSLHEKRPLDAALLLREIDATVPLSRSRAEEVERLRELARDRFVHASRPPR